MQTINTIAEWQQIRKNFPPSARLGLVPTMGNLHAGHASLLQRACQENEITVLTIFVNPTQFNEQQDYQMYPRTVDADLALAKELGVNYVLLPEASVMYADNYTYRIEETEISQYQEGIYRPGHFSGMLTVVLKLLLLTQPQRAYFGEKDYQQLQLVRGLVQAFMLNIDIIGCPIIREPSGLPLSSRNNLLNPEEKQLALQFAKIFQQTELPCSEIIQQLTTAGIKVDYIEDRENRRFAAVRAGRIRLIDNRAIA